MSLCVNTHSKVFQDTAKRLDINENSLENIVHEYINTEGSAEAFPSDYYILSQIEGEPLTNLSEKALKLIELKYNSPIITDSYTEAKAVMDEMSRYFDPKHISFKQKHDGRFQVSLSTNITPIRDRYKGKLIFAQSGTGKSRIADNITVIDSDVLLAQVLGTSPEAAVFALNNLDINQRLAVAEQYHQKIREELAKGHTVLTASLAMMNDADVVVYNETADLTSKRTSAEDRVGSNKYSNVEKANEDISKAESITGKEVIRLDSEHFLSDYLLKNPNFKAIKPQQRTDSLNEAVNSFLKDFNLTVNDLEGYRGDLPLFDGVNRVINAKKSSDVTDAMGYVVAFVMQQEPTLRAIFVREALNQLFPGAQRLFSEDFIDKILSNDKEKSIQLPIGVAKLVGRKYVTPSEIYAHFPGKQNALKTIGNDIAKTLREYYEGKDPKNFVQRIWDVIKEFFDKITHKGYYQQRLDFINSAADAIIRKDSSFIKGADYKVGSTTRASLLNLEEAFKENPFEANIIKKLSNLGISLAGSASIRAMGTIYRPANNPLHDIDFEASGYKSKEELTKALNETFPHIQHFRTIRSRDNKNEYTESYVLLDRPFRLEKETDGKNLLIIDSNTNETLAKVNLKDNEIVESKVPDMKSKLLDFFINTKEQPTYQSYSLTINNEEYLLNDARAAFTAKVKWQRRKDLWDWSRFTPNERFENTQDNTRLNKEESGLFDILDHTSKQKIWSFTRRGEMLSKLNGRYYLPKGTKVEVIERYRERALLPKGFFNYIQRDNSVEVVVNQDILNDAIVRNEKNVGFDDLFTNSKEAEQVHEVLDFLSAKTGLRYETISEAKAKELIGKTDGVNAFVVKNTAYFIEGRKLNTDIAAEEMLHPFVASIRLSNERAFNSLLNDARRAFPRLRLEIAKAYKNDNIEEELVTQALSRAFRQDFEANPNHNAISDLLLKFWNQIKGWFRNIGDLPIFKGDKVYAQDLSESISIENLAKIINTEIELGNADNIDRIALDEDGLSQPQTQTVRESLSKFQEKAAEMTNQLNNLLDSELMSNTEVKHVAEQVVYFISDSITEFLESPEKLFSIFKSLQTMNEKETEAFKEKISKMSRAEFVNFIGPRRLLNFASARLFTYEGNPALNNRTTIKKANLIRNNFDAIIKFAGDYFNLTENSAVAAIFNREITGNFLNIKENGDPYSEDANEDNDVDKLQELGDMQEHWQLVHRTEEVFSSMSELIRQALNRCFQIKIGENGEKEKIPSEFGIAERVGAKDATASILRWTRGAESLSHMIELLEAKVNDNPWLEQIVTRLKDNTGAEADFQSQFYGVFAKAFQPYSVVLKEYNTKTKQYEYRSIRVNQHPALTDAIQSVEVAFKTNNHPLFEGSRINKSSLDTLSAIVNDLLNKTSQSLAEHDRLEIVDLISKASAILGYSADMQLVNLALDNDTTFHNMVDNLKNIFNNLSKSQNVENYDPFKYGGDNNIRNYLSKFLTPITEKLEETAVSSFYDSGKMYQSYVTPSYLTVLMNHFGSDEESFNKFLQEEYGQYEWFRNPDGTWRNDWLNTLSQLSQEERKELFRHKVQLNFNKHNYMRNMSDTEYALSVLAEYFSEFGDIKGNVAKVWYRVPMMSNKPSSEFIRMNAYTGKYMKIKLSSRFADIFRQELSRIQTCEIRDYDKKDPNFIKNFDKNGRKFVMLDFFNKYLKGGSEANSELGHLINKAIEEGTQYDAETKKGLDNDENARLTDLVEQTITTFMDARADNLIKEWKSNGIFEGAKQIKNIGQEDGVVEERLREFVWNDAFAAMNILELTVTDPAFYKDAEDLQKRLAQIHAPGIRANVEATDYEGNRVSDGMFRTLLLTDFDDFISNIKGNLRIVFDRKLKQLKDRNASDAEYRAAKATYDNIIEQFNHINVADAQGYSSPTSYRKKAFLFGKWSRSAEEVYNKLKSDNYNYSDLQTAFQPLKPFVYGQIERPSINPTRNDLARPLSKLKVPVQFKNSEYLLIMADAILQNEDTGRPNLLRAIYEVMEESAERNPTRGIDTIQFESTCKSGLQGRVNIKQFSDVKSGETLAKLELEKAIYNEDGSYNTATYVYEVPFENYAIQQDVPEHFKNHSQAHGSQIRYIITSDLEAFDSDGNPVTYNYFDKGVEKKLSAEEFKKEYENNISENIEESINELSETLGIGRYYLSRKDRNIALSKILLEEILSSPRYGAELAAACTVNSETGEFNIPLGDPIQSKRIEQLINSVVKNRINKQKIAGGPVVQVTNFGTSRELNIRFKAKDGSLLMTRSEFEKSGREGTFEDYIKENQAGIAYYEVFAPIFANELFSKFADKDGNIDIETIEMINPDLLKMIGYRIPTEDKYSMAPLKIVGFLPREAGDGIMLPNDITLLTGSDFDVDKFYLMRKEINIAMRENQPESVTTDNFDVESKEFIKNHREELRNYLKSQIPNRENIQLTEEERQRVENRFNFEIDQENKRHEAALEQIEEDATDALIAFDEQVEAGNALESQEQKAEEKVQKGKERQIKRENRFHDQQLYKYESRKQIALDRARESKLNDIVNDFLDQDIFGKVGDEITRALKEAYINYMFRSIEDTEGITYRNNKIVDMSWAVLTNETTADKMLNPGGFEPEKSMGYLVSAYQNPANAKYTWEQLEALANNEVGLLNGEIVPLDPNNDDIETGTDALKSLCYTEKNLCFFDTHLQFYKQNSAAATALGMAAVQKVGHAVLESNGYSIDLGSLLDLEEDEMFSVAGKEFSGVMEIDKKYDDDRNLIGRVLGEFVAMFADAVKDPVANLMNINNTTMPIITTLIRFGMPFKQAALFISQPIIRRALERYNSENITGFATLDSIINDMINNEFKELQDSKASALNTLTREELIDGLRHSRELTDYKVLRFFQYADKMAKSLKGPTYATRFNSISNAVGPHVVDNLIMEYKVESADFSHFQDIDGNQVGFFDILQKHPILNSFYKALDISNVLLDEMPANSEAFRKMINTSDEAGDLQRTLYGDKKTLSELSDFFQSYLLVSSGAIPVEATKENKHQGLKYYIEQFPSDFIRGKAKEVFKGNSLIDAIKVDIQKDRVVLKIDTTGMTTQDKEKLGDGWVDLYNSGDRGKKLAEHLFYYNFWRTGIGFSPKSFMNLFPTRLKNKIDGYNDAFTVSHSGKFGEGIAPFVIDQFAANNADNNRLVPKVKTGKDGVTYKISNGKYVFENESFSKVFNKFYMRIKTPNGDIILKRITKDTINNQAIYIQIDALGNNGEYFEAYIPNNTREYTPISKIEIVTEQKNEGQLREPEHVNTEAETPVVNDPVTDEQKLNRATKIRDKILELFMDTGRTEEEAKEKIEDFKKKSAEEKQKYKAPMKAFFKNRLIKQGIEASKINEKLLDEMFEELC